MARTNIFLSSTCYDLRALREHLRLSIEQCGHELLASELPSFPVSPGLTTVENCKKVIRERADLLVLVVGGRRGASDPAGGGSVVSAEYQEARRKGIDSFVFVDRKVWECLDLYHRNPGADFSSVVDHSDVFKFVGELKTESRWIYTFGNTSDIIDTLKPQLSGYLRILIEKKRGGILTAPQGFENQSEAVLKLLTERPPYWEHWLTCELLDQTFLRASRKLDDLKNKSAFRRVEVVPLEISSERLSALFSDAMNMAEAMHPALAGLPPTWGPRGASGNPAEIKQACDKIASLVEGLLEWETDVRYLRFPDTLSSAVKELEGSTESFIAQLSRIPRELRAFLELPAAEREGRVLDIQLKIDAPPQLARFSEKLRRINRSCS